MARNDRGEVSEWLKEHAWKACVRRKVYRGFESRPLRQTLGGVYKATMIEGA